MQHVGVDIIEIARIVKAVDRWGDSFLDRIYTGPELKLYADRPSSLAARFSGKEAVIKALGCPGIALKDIEILSDPEGKPLIELYGRARHRAGELGLSHLTISLSHCRDYAVAYAVGEING
jgi:holo-[acyl-carrier protein] synthase